MFRSSIYGSLIGMMPGLGSSVACFVAYGKRRAKNRDKWGTGVVEGIVAPEAANNAVSGPSMIPLLTLGIPGSTIAAVLIGMFLVNGLQPGPSIFAEEPPLFIGGHLISPREFIFGVFAAGLIGIACYALIGYFAASSVGRVIAFLPTKYLYPFIFMTALAASYSSRASIWDVGFALLFELSDMPCRQTFQLQHSLSLLYLRRVWKTFVNLIISDTGFLIFASFEYQESFLMPNFFINWCSSSDPAFLVSIKSQYNF